MSLIQLKDVYKIYAEGQENQVNALDGVTLSIDQGEFVAIIGTSGSGKSTMMNILGCLDVPTRGEYLLDGTPIRERTQRELSQIRSRQIAFIFQGYNLIPSLNVWQTVALPMLGLMRQMNAEGTTVILITHDNGIAAQADRTVRVKDGRIVHDSLWDGVLVDWSAPPARVAP